MHLFLQGACTTTVDLQWSHALCHVNSRSCRIVLFVLFRGDVGRMLHMTGEAIPIQQGARTTLPESFVCLDPPGYNGGWRTK